MSDQPHAPNLLTETAWLYDFMTHFDDADFYLQLAARTGGPILEVGCGTGRITIPLLRAGHEVWGFDLSRPMLNVFQSKLSTLTAHERSRLRISQMDMCDFAFDKSFPLILAPYRVFLSLTKADQRLRFFECVHRHLSKGGRFVLTAFKPWTRLDAKTWVAEERPYGTVDFAQSGEKVVLAETRKSIDMENQIIYPETIAYVPNEKGQSERLVDQLELAYFYEDQLRDLLLHCEFVIEEEWGGYSGETMGEGPELIFICSSSKAV